MNGKRNIREEINSIRKQLVEKYRPDKIFLFGSAAWGGGTPNDLDFLIIKKNVPHYGRDRMAELDKIVNANMAVDLLVYKPEEFSDRLKMGDPFIKLIAQKGEVLYG